ncbi:peptidase domain-containing ABC transporter [Paenibacillus paeoniae]|uniref:ATP-binding cassette domain-containing protein n=1 Tax=Paenibacillus paeoniae TaxID=2292705 RepID=A0A371PN11_9BACL|nr:peptidase domain-containing ABC transporter [Paenibacillus paeoniae]REK77596.1 ATP-binding cassette domain-containing protein [Paenibacillus paeoniae]
MESLLNRVSLFDVMNEQERALLSQRLVPEQYLMGQTIIQTGKPIEAFYIIATGQARRMKEQTDGSETNLGLLQPGEHFGESGLLGREISDITVRASTELWVWKLAKDDFVELLHLQPELEGYLNMYIASDSTLTFLQTSALFSRIETNVLHSLQDKMALCRFEAGTIVVTEGEVGDSLYILRSGRAEVVSESTGQWHCELIEGDYFGGLSLLGGEPLDRTVRMTEESTLLRLSKEVMDVLIRMYPGMREQLVSNATQIYGSGGLAGGVYGWRKEQERAEQAEKPLESALEMEDEQDNSTAMNHNLPLSYEARASKRFRRRYPIVLQQSEMDCGPTCLSMISQYYGIRMPIHTIKAIAGTSRSGTTLQQLRITAQSLGFLAQGYRTGILELAELHLPAIAHWRGNHYVVVYAITNEHVIVGDPAIGIEKLTLEQFADGWNGMLLQLAPTEDMKAYSGHSSTLRRYVSFLKPHSRMLALVLTLSVVIQLLSLSLPVFTQKVIDTVLVDRDEGLLLLLLLGMLAISLANTCFIFIRQWIASKTALQIDMNMIHAFYKHVLRLPLSFFNERTVGDMLARVNENEKLRKILTNSASSFILDLVTIIVYGSLMLYYNAKLFLLAAVIFPLYALLIYVISPRMRRNSRKQFLAEADSDSTMVEAVQHIAAVKSLTAEQKVFDGLKLKFKKAMDLRLKGMFLWVSAEAGSEWIRTLGTIIVLFFGSRYVLANEMTAGELVAFTVLLATVTQSFSYLIQMMDDLMEARISVERLDDVFQASPEQKEDQHLRKLARTSGHLVWDNVTFRYEEDGTNALQNVSFEMFPGQTVALVGRSGSGKSTMANLITRLYLPASGRITLDGYDLQSIDVESLRSHIGVVQQETAIFRGSIRDNIAFRQPDASHQDIEAAAVLAGAHDFIRNTALGYETMIGEGGMRLSGGQSQRIAIARALLGNPPLLLFDEATSALDTESERLIQHNMKEMLKHRTTLIIAHRLSTVKHADRILVLDKGCVVESGTHDELMESGGLYSYLIHQQLA